VHIYSLRNGCFERELLGSKALTKNTDRTSRGKGRFISRGLFNFYQGPPRRATCLSVQFDSVALSKQEVLRRPTSPRPNKPAKANQLEFPLKQESKVAERGGGVGGGRQRVRARAETRGDRQSGQFHKINYTALLQNDITSQHMHITSMLTYHTEIRSKSKIYRVDIN